MGVLEPRIDRLDTQGKDKKKAVIVKRAQANLDLNKEKHLLRAGKSENIASKL